MAAPAVNTCRVGTRSRRLPLHCLLGWTAPPRRLTLPPPPLSPSRVPPICPMQHTRTNPLSLLSTAVTSALPLSSICSEKTAKTSRLSHFCRELLIEAIRPNQAPIPQFTSPLASTHSNEPILQIPEPVRAPQTPADDLPSPLFRAHRGQTSSSPFLDYPELGKLTYTLLMLTRVLNCCLTHRSSVPTQNRRRAR